MPWGRPHNYQPRHSRQAFTTPSFQPYANIRPHPFDPYHPPNTPHSYMYTDYPDAVPPLRFPTPLCGGMFADPGPGSCWIPPPFPPAPPVPPISWPNRASPDIFGRCVPLEPWVKPAFPPPPTRGLWSSNLLPPGNPDLKIQKHTFPLCSYPLPPGHRDYKLQKHLLEIERMDDFENKRIKDIWREKELWRRANKIAEELEMLRLNGYSLEDYENPASQGMNHVERGIALDDKLYQDKFDREYLQGEAEKKTQENIREYGYSACAQEQQRKKEEQEELQKQRQQELWQREYEEQARSVNRGSSFASGFLLAVLGFLWFLIQGLASVVSVVVMTFWNRYQEYDVPAAPTPQQQRSDEDVLNAQFQREMFQEQPNYDDQAQSGASWTDSAGSFLLALLNGFWRLVIALIYSVWQLVKGPLLGIWPFVRDNKSTSLLFALVFLLVFNPWRPHPERMAVQDYLVSPPPPPITPFPPPNVAPSHDWLTEAPPDWRTEMRARHEPAKVRSIKAFLPPNAWIDPAFPTRISWGPTVIGSPEWEEEEAEWLEFMRHGEWPFEAFEAVKNEALPPEQDDSGRW